jgi:class 3 adenylate cyclase
VPVFLVLPYRGFVYHKTQRKIADTQSLSSSLYGLPWKEFRADLAAWLLAGGLMASLYLLYFHAPYLTALKVVLGCLCFGLFGGMLSLLNNEKYIMEQLKKVQLQIKAAPLPRRMVSVSTKMLYFVVTVLLFMVVAILLMVYMDLNFLLSNRDFLGPDTYLGVFKEIVFAFGVLLCLSLAILGRYSQNLKRVLTLQIDAMENIGRGDYQSRVPVVTNDEFGLIASKTNQLIEGLKERDACQISFGKYMTPEVSEKILKGEVSAEGETSLVTMLFCDLRAYTPFVERRDPKEVVRFLNSYFSEMEDAVREHNGIVLQYIGDEIEAVFGAPIPEPNHPEMAVKAALEMRRRLAELNRQRQAGGDDPIRHGIGIHTGEVLAGSVGSPQRLVYAMVGDAVNLASRIQTLNKKFDTDILISQTTKARLSSKEFRLASLGVTTIRGKREKIEIYSAL